MASEMTEILTYIDQLRGAVAASAAGAPEAGAAPPATPLRDDEPRASIDRDSVARNAPAWRDGFFVVPKVIGGE
jgi:aspartyl/glutamyl-tRNA(Asn/Gln) amidotransferase C subunit